MKRTNRSIALRMFFMVVVGLLLLPQPIMAQAAAKANINMAVPIYYNSKDTAGNYMLQTLVDTYAKKHPGSTVTLQWIPVDNWSGYFNKLGVLLASNSPPDCFYVPAEGPGFAYGNKIAQPLNSYFDKHKDVWNDYVKYVPPALVKMGMNGSDIYGMILLFELDAIWLNTDRLKQAGLSIPDSNWKWDEFVRYCEVLTKSAKKGQYAFGLPVDSAFVYNGWLYSFGTAYLTDDYKKIDFGSERSIELMQFMYDAVKKGWAPLPDKNYGNLTMIANGSIAMAGAGRWGAAVVKGSGFENVVPCYIPRKYSDRKSLAYGSFYVSAKTKNYDAVADFCAWTGGTEFQNGFIVISGNPASRKDVNTKKTLPYQFEHSEIFLDIPDTAVSMNNPKFFPAVEQIMFRAYSSMLSNEVTPRVAAQNAAAEMQRELDQNPVDYLKK